MSKEKANIKTFHYSGRRTAGDISPSSTKQKLKKTANKKIAATRDLKEQAKIIDDFFTGSITPLALLDKDFNFIQVNDAYAKIWEHNTSYFTGKNRFDFDPSNVRPIFEEVVRTKMPYKAIEFPFTFVDHLECGKTYWNWNLTPRKPSEPEEWALTRAVRNSETSINKEIEVECFDGTHKIILNSAIPIQDDRRQVNGGNCGQPGYY